MAGLAPRCSIHAINGKDVDQMRIDEAQSLLVGEKNSSVSIEFTRLRTIEDLNKDHFPESATVSLRRTTRYRYWMPYYVSFKNKSGVFVRTEPSLESDPIATVRNNPEEPEHMQFRVLDMNYPGPSQFRKVRISGWITGNPDEFFHMDPDDSMKWVVKAENVPVFAHWHNVEKKRAPVIHLFPGLQVRHNMINNKPKGFLEKIDPHQKESTEGFHVSFVGYMVGVGHETGRTYIKPAPTPRARVVKK